MQHPELLCPAPGHISLGALTRHTWVRVFTFYYIHFIVVLGDTPDSDNLGVMQPQLLSLILDFYAVCVPSAGDQNTEQKNPEVL